MAYKCRVCGSNEVDKSGDICESCAIAADPDAIEKDKTQAPQQPHDTACVPKRGRSRKILINCGSDEANKDSYENDTSSQLQKPPKKADDAAQASQQAGFSPSPGQAPSRPGNHPITTGVTKNLVADTQERPPIEKWFQALFGGIPFAFHDDVTLFQVFPDHTSASLTAIGNACDQVIMYGRLNRGAVSENNEVAVYGHRDSNNNIIATEIRNKASGTVVKPQWVIPVWGIWTITLVLLGLIIAAIAIFGIKGAVWATIAVLMFTKMPWTAKFALVLIGVILSLFL